jgi:hypothetical protein
MITRHNNDLKPPTGTRVRPDDRPAWLRQQRWPAVAWTLWALFVLGLGAVAWLDDLLRQAGRPDLVLLTTDASYIVLALASGATVGAVVASRRPRHPVGWLLLGFALLTSTAEVTSGYAGYAVLARPGALPAADAAAVFSYANNDGAAVALLALAVLFTPSGTLPSPRWRWVVRALVVLTAFNALAALVAPNPADPPVPGLTSLLAVDALSGPGMDVVRGVGESAWLLMLLAAAASLLLRFRRARGAERQQLKWVAFAAALAPVAVLVTVGGNLTGHPTVTAATSYAPGIATFGVPLALGAAVLRYRLYDLDRIISRTLAYGLLTVLLGGAYAGMVLGLGQLVGQDSSLLVAGATLAVATAFQPARRHIQQAVDRRFNRRRYDAARTIQGFSARLRQQIDLDGLTAELLAVVDQTMQPTRVSLWLHPTTTPHKEIPTQPGLERGSV